MEKKYIEIWGDLVSIKELLLSIFLISICTMGAYFVAPNNPTFELFFGLGGAIIGFIIATIFVKPKRNLHLNEKEEEK